MWTGKWTKELDLLYEKYFEIFNVEPDCDTDKNLDDIGYYMFKAAILKSLITQERISL